MKTAINLYSIRELDESMPTILERVSEAGYDGVQFSGGLRGTTPDQVATTLERHDLEVAGSHVGLEDLEDDLEAVHNVYADTLGVPSTVVPWIGPEHFANWNAIASTITRLDALTTSLAEYDWPLHYHNHDHEFRRVNGEYALTQVLDAIPSLGFEIDVGWVATGGEDPVDYIDRYADRIEMVHMKDMAIDSSEFREIGRGDVNMAACASAAHDASAEWLIYEHDEPDDPIESITTGAEFLTNL
jgi:sugar phosphate isomerase/epimerase